MHLPFWLGNIIFDKLRPFKPYGLWTSLYNELVPQSSQQSLRNFAHLLQTYWACASAFCEKEKLLLIQSRLFNFEIFGLWLIRDDRLYNQLNAQWLSNQFENFHNYCRHFEDVHMLFEKEKMCICSLQGKNRFWQNYGFSKILKNFTLLVLQDILFEEWMMEWGEGQTQHEGSCVSYLYNFLVSW